MLQEALVSVEHEHFLLHELYWWVMVLEIRGAIKRTLLMLPEHVEEIQNLRREDEQVEKADLDEQKLEEIEFALQRLRATTYQ